MQDLQSAGIQVGEASTTVPSSETTESTVVDTKTTASEEFVDKLKLRENLLKKLRRWQKHL